MKKLFLTIILVLVMSITTTYSATESISCTFKSSCSVNEEPLFRFDDTLSSNVRILSYGNSDGNYNNVLCCSSPIDNLTFATVGSSSSCTGEQFMYFTGDTNARTAYEYDPTHHNYKMCVRTENSYTNIDILAVDRATADRYEEADYNCLYRTSGLANGHFGGCNESEPYYAYTVIARVFDTLDNTPCNADCTSELDGRVYPGCRYKISSCSLMPFNPGFGANSDGEVCAGSRAGDWVQYNETHEVQCIAPWNGYRERAFVDEEIEIVTSGGECNNLINVEYTTIVNGEQVSMLVYTCQD